MNNFDLKGDREKLPSPKGLERYNKERD